MKQITKFLACALSLSMLLSGCGGNAGSAGGNSGAEMGAAPGDTSEQIELRFSWWGADTRHDAIQDIIKLYEDKNPNITIKPEYGAWDGWTQNILTQLGGQTEADILMVNYNWLYSFGRGQNVFLDLNTVSDYIDLDNWDQEYLDFMTVNGELGALPYGMNARGYLYSTPLFAEYGIDSYPATYDELMDAAKLISADNTPTGADNRYALLLMSKESRDLYFAQMLYNHTGKRMQEDGQVQYTVDEVVWLLEMITAMEEAGVLPTFEQEDPIDNESNPVWTSGRGGSTYEWISTIDKYFDSYKGGEAKDEMAVATYVTEGLGDKPTIYVKPNFGYTISKNTKNAAIAADFLNFFFSDEEAVKRLGTANGVASNKVAAEIQEREGMLEGIVLEFLQMLEGYDQVVMDPYFEDANVRGERYTAIEAYRTGKSTAQEAAEDYINRQQQELDKLLK